MELRALAGSLQQGVSGTRGCRTSLGAYSSKSSTALPRRGNLSLWGDPRFLGGRGAKDGALVWRCSSEADAGRSQVGIRDEDAEFWEYEVTQHLETTSVNDVREECAKGGAAVAECETRVRPEFVVPKIKFTRESKGLKPTFRVFSKDRKTVPKPIVNPYVVLMKMIDPANDDEYLDSDSKWQSAGKLKDGHGLRDPTSRLERTDLVETVDDDLQLDGAGLDVGDVSRTMKSDPVFERFGGDDTAGYGPKWQLRTEDALSDEEEGDGYLDRGLSQQLDRLTVRGSDENELEDNVDEEGDLVTGYGHGVASLSDVWSDSDDEGDEDDGLARDSDVVESVKEDATDGEDPLRRFLNSRTGNSDSKVAGKVYKYNKAARKPVRALLTKSGLYRSGSLILGKEAVHPSSNTKDSRGRLVCRANSEETGSRFSRSNAGEKQTDSSTSAVREVLQIAYNLPKDRVLEDYMAPFVSKFDSVQANLVFEALCGDDLTDQALSFFRWMRLHEPCLWNSRSFSLLFAFLGRMGMPDQALAYFGMLPEEKKFHSVQVYNSLITCLANCNRQDGVPGILEKMQSLGYEPDAVTFSILMNTAAKGGRSITEVWALYQDMVQRGVYPSVAVFGTLIKAFCDSGHLKEALLITTEMEKLNVPLNAVVYNILINAFGRAGNLEVAEGLMSEMQERGVHPNVGTYNALICSYLESKQFAVAEGLIDEMESSGLQPDVVTFTALLGAYGHEGMTEKAAQVFSRMEARAVKPNSHSYTTLISAYAAGRWPEKAVEAFERMRREGVSPTVETFTALMDAYRLAGDLEMVDTVWKTMKTEGCGATRVTYMTVLDAFQKQGRFKEVRDLIEEFRNRGHEPDVMVYNMLLNSYMRGGRHLKAGDLLQEIKSAGIRPDAFTYCTLIYGFLRVRDHTKALKYHREMMDGGQLPDAKTYAKLRAILKVVEKRRDSNNRKSARGKPSKPAKKGTEKYKSYWKRDK